MWLPIRRATEGRAGFLDVRDDSGVIYRSMSILENGEELWKFQTGAGANGPVSTFAVNGEQYVAVLAGGNNILLSARGDFLWTLKLGGTLPEASPAAPPPLVHPGTPAQPAR